MISRRL